MDKDNSTTCRRRHGFALALLMLLPGLLAAAPPSYRQLWPRLPQPWYFNVAADLAVAASGTLYITDTWNHRIVQLAPNGDFIRTWGVPGTERGEFDYPQGVGIAPDGSLYVADTDNHRIQRFSAEGVWLHGWGRFGSGPGQFDAPKDVAVDSAGQVYVADKYNHRIQVFDADGGYLRGWGEFGRQPGQFDQPVSLSFTAAGVLLVADSHNHRIQAFDSRGAALFQFGGSGWENGQFNKPWGVLAARDGSIYVADSDNHRLQQFTATGDFVRSWGQWGNGDGDFIWPNGIGQGADGTLYVSEGWNGRVQLFDGKGVFREGWSGMGAEPGYFSRPAAATVAPDGSLFVADTWNHRIQRFSRDGVLLRIWGREGDGDGELRYPEGIACAGDGSVYVADTQNHRIQRFSGDGHYLSHWGGEGDGAGQFRAPTALAWAAAGELLVADSGNHRVQRFDAAGRYLGGFGEQGEEPGQLQQPKGLTVNADGDIFVADTGNNRIQRFDREQKFLRAWGTWGSAPEQLIAPSGLAWSEDGTLYVADLWNHRVQMYDGDGAWLGRLAGPGSAPGSLSQPTDLALGADGLLYIVDSGNNRIQQFAALGDRERIQRAIILAGGGPSRDGYVNHIWDETQMLANKAYNTLRGQGFDKDRIRYLSPVTDMDLDGNGLLDDLLPATLEQLNRVIREWAADTDELLLYLIDHGGPERFQVNPEEVLDSAQLRDWLDTVPGRGIQTLIIEACKSGSFIAPLADTSGRRHIVTSADPQQPARIGNHGLDSFSYYFWSEINDGATLADAFHTARRGMASQLVAGRSQAAQLDADGDGQTSDNDYRLTRDYCLGRCDKYAANPPVILDSQGGLRLDGERQADLWIQVTGSEPLARAWALIGRPDFQHFDDNQPVSDLPRVDLTCDANRLCRGSYREFDVIGDYLISFYAQDQQHQLSLPLAALASQSQGFAAGVDRFDSYTGRVQLNRLDYRQQSYQVQLGHIADGRFDLLAYRPSPDPPVAATSSYRSEDDHLEIREILVLGATYRALLKQTGGWRFQLTEMQPLTP